jgi:hypothetical protein
MVSITHDTFQFREGGNVLWEIRRNLSMTIWQRHQLHGIVDYARIEGSGEVPSFLFLKG